MKHKTESEKLTNNQKLKGIRNVTSGKYLTNLIVRQDLNIPNIFLIQNKGKGPPGRTCSPGLVDYLTRANQPAAFNEPPPELIEGNKTFNENEMSMICRNINRNDYSPIMRIPSGKKNKLKTDELLIQTKPNLYSQLNFTIMKKQILFLVMALFAVNVAFGQLNRSLNPVPTLGDCASNATFLNPVSGVPYDYSMNGTTGAEQVDQWLWFATKDPNFMTASNTFTNNKLIVSPGQLLNASNYNTLGASATVTITWTPEILANTDYQGTPSLTGPSPTFVVGYGQGTNCADNIKVYEINPIVNFVASIAPIDPGTLTSTAWGSTTSSCVADVTSATYSAGNLVVDYGVNTVYFEIAAANFVTDFTPYLTLMSGLNGSQTAVVTLYNTLSDAIAGSNATGTTTWTSASIGSTWSATTTHFSAASSNDVVNGVSAFVKVVITNSSYESLIANPFTLAFDARDNGNTGIWDMEDADCTALVDDADQADQATQNITPRPTIVGANIPDANTLDPNDLVPKNP